MCNMILCLLKESFLCDLKSRSEGNGFISKGLFWCLAGSGWRSRWRCVSPPSTWRHKHLVGDIKQVNPPFLQPLSFCKAVIFVVVACTQLFPYKAPIAISEQNQFKSFIERIE